MKKKVKKDISKKEILRVATEEFAHKGFKGARIEVIAHRAVVNQAMIYYHYGCKDKLYARAIRDMADREFGNAWPEFPDAWNLSLPEKLCLSLYYFVHYQLTVVDPKFTRLIAWDLAEDNKILKSVMQDYFMPLIQKLAELLQQGVAAGEFSVNHPYMFVHIFFSTLAWYRLRRETLAGTEIFDKIYEEETVEKFAAFFIEHSLKSLSPAGKVLSPVIVPEHVRYVQEMLTAKANSKRGGK